MKKSNAAISTSDAVRALSAIAHEGRLTLLRLLIQKGPEGLAAGSLARAAQVNAPTASAQLLVLMNAGLVNANRQGRHIIYRAQFQAMSQLLGFLMKDCCGGDRDICNPLLKALRS
ncbi:MAG: ArsR/SmtB family transcription factor [Pseudomonadales bacterium]